MMTATVLTYVHPLIRDYQRANEAYFGGTAPRVTRRSNKTFVIHGCNGDRLVSEAHLLKITNALRLWDRDRRQA